MDDIYLVEIRLGRTKWRVKQTVHAIARKFHIRAFMEQHPHVTLFGPMELMEGVNENMLLDGIATVAEPFDPLPFTLDRFETREGMHGSVIAFSVHPSDGLRQMIADLSLALLPIARSHNAWDDRPEQKWYHVTVANHLDRGKAASVFRALPEPGAMDGNQNVPAGFIARILCHLRCWTGYGARHLIQPLLLDETGLRITVMHGETILAEYDLLEKQWVFDDHRHDSAGWQAALARFRKVAGFEHTVPNPPVPGDTLLIADLHLGHANIIRYCSRPFSFQDPYEMDRVLIANWNAAVLPGTRIFHIGDLSYGKTARPAREYCEQLKGEVTYITGNHDSPDPGSPAFAVIEHDGLRFYLVHDPADAPAGFDGWVVHGHHHNNDLRNYPFIDFVRRRINVSAEVTGYVPASLSGICELIRYRTAAGNTRPVLLNYPYVG